MSLRLGFDTGGTYTDAVLYDPARGVVASAKALTTKHDLAIGLSGAFAGVRAAIDAPIALVSLSTTLATNALVEGHGSPVGLLLLGYPASVLEKPPLRDALGEDPALLLPGGHDPLGEEQAPLDLAAVRDAVTGLAGRVAAFAVSGFFSVRNPAHEIAVRRLIREATDRPVTCGHELSAKLDAPRRALTALLNARLIPQLQALIAAVRGLLAESAIGAPLMVVKGDGSLVGAEVAALSPVETILSGPAASVVGARHLAGVDDVFVSDIGGTTTDIALLRGGRPVLNREGAVVGGFRTMVEAVEVRTFGLGGDSEVHATADGLRLGPRRVVPLSLAAIQHPGILATLERQLADEPGEQDGRFALRQRALDAAVGLPPAQARLWAALADGPRPVAELASGYASERALARLVDRGLVIIAALTPSDAAHLLGRQQGWSVDAARAGAALFCRRWAARLGGRPDPAALAGRIVEQVVRQSAEALLDTALAEWRGAGGVAAGGIGSGDRPLVDEALAGPAGRSTDLLSVSLSLGRPIVAIGAPAASYYPEIAARLGTRLVAPRHAEVCNAVGAVVGGVSRTVSAVITAPAEGRFRAHLPDGVADFTALEPAAAAALAALRRLATGQARAAGAAELEVRESRDDRIVREADGLELFVESRLAVTAFGRPRLADEAG
jgi:N-methylhydantoinase A/oxoprolinase/acetone carboxylase beta subunit